MRTQCWVHSASRESARAPGWGQLSAASFWAPRWAWPRPSSPLARVHAEAAWRAVGDQRPGEGLERCAGRGDGLAGSRLADKSSAEDAGATGTGPLRPRRRASTRARREPRPSRSRGDAGGAGGRGPYTRRGTWPRRRRPARRSFRRGRLLRASGRSQRCTPRRRRVQRRPPHRGKRPAGRRVRRRGPCDRRPAWSRRHGARDASSCPPGPVQRTRPPRRLAACAPQKRTVLARPVLQVPSKVRPEGPVAEHAPPAALPLQAFTRKLGGPGGVGTHARPEPSRVVRQLPGREKPPSRLPESAHASPVAFPEQAFNIPSEGAHRSGPVATLLPPSCGGVVLVAVAVVAALLPAVGPVELLHPSHATVARLTSVSA